MEIVQLNWEIILVLHEMSLMSYLIMITLSCYVNKIRQEAIEKYVAFIFVFASF
jgi:hypothetical protein